MADMKLTPGLSDFDETPSSQPVDDKPVDNTLAPSLSGLDDMPYSVSVPPKPETKADVTAGDVMGGAALGYGANKLVKSNTLSRQVINNAINLRNANKKVEAIEAEPNPAALELDEAQRGHDYWHSDQAIHDNFNPDNIPKPVAPAPEPIQGGIKPLGGEGVSNYAEKFGATQNQANAASSMQDVQQNIIPENQLGNERIQGLTGSKPVAVQGSEILFPNDPESVKLGIEHGAKQMQAETQAKTNPQTEFAQQQAEYEQKLAEEKAKAQAKINEQRLASKDRLKSAEEDFRKSQEKLRNATSNRDRIAANLGQKTNDIKPALAQRAENIATKGTKLSDVGNMFGSTIRRLGIPAMAASIPYEYRQAKEAYNKGDIKGAWEHGLSAGAGGLGLAGEGLVALGAAPELGAGLATASTIGGLGLLGHDIYQNAPAISKYVTDKYNKLVGD
jgi:hypothetical protein